MIGTELVLRQDSGECINATGNVNDKRIAGGGYPLEIALSHIFFEVACR
jgi:hypothetical protein